MSRALGRWIVLGVLGVIVVALGISTSLSNRRLVEGLANGSPEAFALFAERQDAYIFLQSEPVEKRIEIARSLATWDSPTSAKLALVLVPDPDPVVRAALVDSLANTARRHPRAVAAEFAAGGAAESAALLEAASRDSKVGIEVLRSVLADSPLSPNGMLLAKRLGPVSESALVPLLAHPDEGVRLAAAGTLASIGLDPEDRVRVSAVLLNMYHSADTQSLKDQMLPILSKLAPAEGAAVFIEIALDHTAPSDLRAIATRALAKIGNPIVSELANDADTSVATAAKK